MPREYDGGDHTIVVGQVRDLAADASKVPLLFHRGRYGLARPDCPQEESQ